MFEDTYFNTSTTTVLRTIQNIVCHRLTILIRCLSRIQPYSSCPNLRPGGTGLSQPSPALTKGYSDI